MPENVHYARKLAADFGIGEARFIESNVLEIMDHHHEKYDVVYTSEGVLCWLPDLYLWARNVRHLLVGEVVTSLSQAGLHIEWLHEFDWLFSQLSDDKQVRDAGGGMDLPRAPRQASLHLLPQGHREIAVPAERA